MEGYRQARELNSAGEVEFPLYAGAGPEDKVTVKVEAEEEMEDQQGKAGWSVNSVNAKSLF